MAASANDTGQITEKRVKRRHFLVDAFFRLINEKPMGTVGGIIVLIFLFLGIFADLLAPYGFNDIHLAARLSPPSPEFLIGTDNLGRDLLSRILFGARISMYVGLGASTLDAFLATFIGIVSGYFGGKIDIVTQRFVDAWMCFPPLFFYLAVMALLGPGLIQVILVLGIFRGIRSSRIIRSAVIGIKQNIYVEAAKAIGAPNPKILTRHILPNVLAPVIIVFTIAMGQMIVAEATLSFLGFGIPPPTPSWGGMLSMAGRRFMEDAPWMALWPGISLATVVYGINMFGDALRDLFDPRLRGGIGRYEGAKIKKTIASG